MPVDDRPMQQANRPKRLGLALGGGGARGLAHIGLLKEFPPDLLIRPAVPGDIDILAGLTGPPRQSRPANAPPRPRWGRSGSWLAFDTETAWT